MGGGSQRLLSLNPTKVMVVLLLGLWLLLGCDNMKGKCLEDLKRKSMFTHKLVVNFVVALEYSNISSSYFAFLATIATLQVSLFH